MAKKLTPHVDPAADAHDWAQGRGGAVGETDKAFTYFVQFMQMDAKVRSIAKLALNLHLTERALRRYWRRNRWQGRSAAYDRYQFETSVAVSLEKYRGVVEKARSTAEAKLQSTSVADRMISSLITEKPDAMQARDPELLSLAKVSAAAAPAMVSAVKLLKEVYAPDPSARKFENPFLAAAEEDELALAGASDLIQYLGMVVDHKMNGGPTPVYVNHLAPPGGRTTQAEYAAKVDGIIDVTPVVEEPVPEPEPVGPTSQEAKAMLAARIKKLEDK